MIIDTRLGIIALTDEEEARYRNDVPFNTFVHNVYAGVSQLCNLPPAYVNIARLPEAIAALTSERPSE